MTLNDIQECGVASIKNINVHYNLLRRLYALGLKEGSVVKVTRESSFGGPVTIKTNNSLLSIRCLDAANITVATS